MWMRRGLTALQSQGVRPWHRFIPGDSSNKSLPTLRQRLRGWRGSNRLITAPMMADRRRRPTFQLGAAGRGAHSRRPEATTSPPTGKTSEPTAASASLGGTKQFPYRRGA